MTPSSVLKEKDWGVIGEKKLKSDKKQALLCFFTRFRTIFGVRQRPLTPSFVGSNPATPAKDTVYCIVSIYGYNIWYFNFLFNLCQRGKRRKIGTFLEVFWNKSEAKTERLKTL